MSLSKRDDAAKSPIAVVLEVGMEIARRIEKPFQKNNIDMKIWRDAVDPDALLQRSNADMLIFSLNLREKNPLQLCLQIKARSSIPIVMISPTYQEVDRILSLEMGADDCLPIDFNPRDLIARIRGSVNREMGRASASMSADDFRAPPVMRLRPATRQAIFPSKRPVSFSEKEFELLQFLYENSGKLLTRDDIFAYLYDQSADAQTQTINVMIYRLRHKIEDDPRRPKFLKSVRRRGYIFELDDAV